MKVPVGQCKHHVDLTITPKWDEIEKSKGDELW